MSNTQAEDDKSKQKDNEGALQPDQETLHTTDPQEHMEGPISSLVKKTAEGFENEEPADGEKEKDDK